MFALSSPLERVRVRPPIPRDQQRDPGDAAHDAQRVLRVRDGRIVADERRSPAVVRGLG